MAATKALRSNTEAKNGHDETIGISLKGEKGAGAAGLLGVHDPAGQRGNCATPADDESQDAERGERHSLVPGRLEGKSQEDESEDADEDIDEDVHGSGNDKSAALLISTRHRGGVRKIVVLASNLVGGTESSASTQFWKGYAQTR